MLPRLLRGSERKFAIASRTVGHAMRVATFARHRGGGRLPSRAMNTRSLLTLLAALLLAGCAAPYKKKDDEARKPLRDAANDQSFQAFVGRLRTAVAKRDVATLTSMMTTDFGYRWDPAPPSENVFGYWDENGVWLELEAVLREKFVPVDTYMVAPPQFATDPNYNGYRAGLRQIKGAWRFAYFVPAETPAAPAAVATPN
jgi:hypothetical protein